MSPELKMLMGFLLIATVFGAPVGVTLIGWAFYELEHKNGR